MSTPQDNRLALDEPARLAPNDWSSVEIRMLECTATGFRASSELNIRRCSIVTLDVPGIGSARAYVTWRRADQFAATFFEPIDLAKARFMPLNGEIMLARLLRERAKAHAAGRNDEERDLRGRIRQILPMKPV
jgi:hypothetical protein